MRNFSGGTNIAMKRLLRVNFSSKRPKFIQSANRGLIVTIIKVPIRLIVVSLLGIVYRKWSYYASLGI